MKEHWLNAVLHLSSLIHRKKSALFSARIFETLILSLQIILLEILLAVISLPFYLFITPDEAFKVNRKELYIYRLRRKITFVTLGIFLIWLFARFLISVWGLISFPQEARADLTVVMTVSGTYTGNATDNRAITGVGFQPDVVWIDGNNSSNTKAVVRTSTMVGDNSKVLDSADNTYGPNYIQSLDSDGFTIGDNPNVNNNGVTYYWTAWKTVAGSMAVGSYTGDGQSSQQIDGLGFQPDYVITLPSNAGWASEKISAMPGNVSTAFTGEDVTSTNRITSLASPSNGFTIGNSSHANTNGVTYHYIAWKEVPGRMDVGSYVGTGTDNRNVTIGGGISFQSDFVHIKGGNFASGMWRNSSMVGDFSLDITSQGNPVENTIQAINSDGFQLGDSSRVNGASVTYYYVAFLRSVPPSFTQTAYRFFENTDGTSAGSALAARDTAATLSAAGDAFRLRMLMHVGNDQLVASGETFKLQFAGKGIGTCASPEGTPSSYTDVTDSTIIAFKDNTTPTDGVALTPNGNDPTHDVHTVVSQTYEESNNFTNSIADIPLDQDGEWDFSLYDNGAAASTHYCFRMVRSNGSVLDTYSVYPEIVTAAGDVTAPTVTSVTSSTSDGSYKAGQSISIQVTFSEAVTVTGTPQLTLETGVSDAIVNYASGSGTDTLTFTYTIASGENSTDLDYVGTDSLALNGGTIRDAASNDANLTLPAPGGVDSLSANKNLVVDSTAPTIIDVTSSTPNGTYSIGGIISIQVQFSEAVTVTDTPQLTLETGASDAVVNYASGSGTDTLTFTYTVAAGEDSDDLDYVGTNSLALNGGTIQDTATNDANLTLPVPGGAGSLSVNKNIVINTDVTPPTVSNVTSTKPNGTYGIDEAIPVVVEWDEVVIVTGTPQITMETGDSDGIATYTSGSGTNTLTFTYTVQAGHASADLDYTSVNALALAGGTIKDEAGNNATLTLPALGSGSLAFNKDLVIDTTPPDTTDPTIMNVTSSTPNGAYKEGEIISIQVEMSENVTVTGSPRLLMEVGNPDEYATYSSGSGTSILTFTYTIAAGHNNTDLDYVGSDSFDLNGGTIQDAAANNLVTTLPSPGIAGSLSTNKDITVDTTSATVIDVTSPKNNGSYGAGEELLIRIEFSEAVDVTGTPQLQLETGSVDAIAMYTSGSGSDTLTFTYTILDGDNSTDLDYVSINALSLNGGTIQDGAGNDATLNLPAPGGAGSLGNNKDFVIDTLEPTISNVTASTIDSTYNTDDSIQIQIQFTEAVTVTGTPQLTLETGATDAIANYDSGSGTDTLTFTYVVQENNSTADLDYANTTALSLNSGTIQDSVGNNATLTLPEPGDTGSLSANKDIVIDAIKPATTVINLSGTTASSVIVSWTAPGDDGASGTAASYDLRYSTSPITNGNFASAQNAGYNTAPQAAGAAEEAIIAGLSSGTTYYFALKTTDEAGNVSDISNIPQITTASEPTPPSPTPPPPSPSPSPSPSPPPKKNTGSSGGGGGFSSSPNGQSPTSLPPPSPNPVAPSPAPGNETPPYFADTVQHWSKKYVEQLQEKCHVTGYTSVENPDQHDFRPDSPISRAELVTLLMKCSDGVLTASSTKAIFRDVPANHWAGPYIERAIEKGMITTANALFRPNDSVILAEALKMILLARFDKVIVEASKAPPECKDVKAKDWFAPYFGYAVNIDMITRYRTNGGKCEPSVPVTRGEVAKILMMNAAPAGL